MEDAEAQFLDVDEMGLNMQYFGTYDYIVFVFMLFICSGIGIYWGFIKKQDAQEYLIGSRNMKIIPVSLSLVASYISGISLLGTPTEIYIYGTQYMFIIIGVLIMGYILAYVFLPVFHDLKLTSLYEYLELRFDRKMRLFGSILFTIGLISWLPIVIYVPALAFNQVSGVNVHVITPIVCVICIFYTCVGGLQAVVWTDVIQTIMMFGAMVLVAIKGSMDIGGFGVVISRNWDSGRIEAPVWDPNPFVRHTVWCLIIGGCVNWLVNSGSNQTLIQRYLSLPNLLAAQKAVVYFMIGSLTIVVTCCYCGMLTYATYYDCDPLTTKLAKAKDQLLPLLVMDVLKDFPGLPGLFVAGVFSAALSSLSTGLNSMAAVVLEDFYKPFAKKDLTETQAGILMKSVVIILGVICICLVFVVEKLGSVLQLSISISSVSNGATLGIFTMGILLPKIHSKGALTGGITSVLAMMWICYNAQAAIVSGNLKFPVKPTNIEGCTYSFNRVMHTSNNQNSTVDESSDEVFILYRLSYVWYTSLGMIISIIVGMIVSLVWDPIDSTSTTSKLLTPCIRKYYAKKHKESFQLQQVVEENETKTKNSCAVIVTN